MSRPHSDACAEYFRQYVDLVPDGDFAVTFGGQFSETMGTLEALSEDLWAHRYDVGKWSVKGVVGHMVDTERIMTTRALAFARGESRNLPGFEQNDYNAAADFDARRSSSLVAEWKGLRAANLALWGSLGDAELDRQGQADDKLVTVRALFWIVAGHERHHMNVIRERYL